MSQQLATTTSQPWDVLVVGGGNAGLCAAISARQESARVLLVEKAEQQYRGGNSSLTMNFRFPHQNEEQLLALINVDNQTAEGTETLRRSYEPYSEEAFLNDLVRTSDELCDRDLARSLASGAWETVQWLRSIGHCWEYKPSILPGAVPVRLKSSGRRLQQHSFEVAEQLGVEVKYTCRLEELVMKGGRVIGADVNDEGVKTTIFANTVVLACGGYQANPELRRQHLGAAWENVALRGVPYNTGDGHLAAQRVGAIPYGDYQSCHATPQSSRLAPHMLPGSNEESQSNSRYCFNYGVTVNLRGERFIDEGQDLPNFVYAKLGKAIVRQPEQIAFQIFDSNTAGFLPRSYFQARNVFRADTLAALAQGLGIDPNGFERTMIAFNQGASNSAIDLLRLDGIATRGVKPSKSNWAAKIETGPFYGCPVRAGITFAYGGIRIDANAQVLDQDGRAIPGLYAAGEIVGGIFCGNYAGGTGMMSGSYFGRIAGKRAAQARR
jgi:tricarballylate dehydrogenase